ncbi:MAG: DNA polymerase III subunit gamma/tau [Sandaracinaceae bacterium]
MAYTVMARKYRPQTFSDLVGQEHVTRTLSNAITSGRVAHAFLFTGVRGVGKTTTARILAKALNCEKGPTPEPCGVCDICVSITDGRDTDVLEMDGASNNSVEDVRRLQESIPYRPSRDRFKVVIVDEVHMLSTGAFNAFLKTLEEPPEHVKFIFATTEAHKVPVTIRSRCQRYDFRLIPEGVVAARVREILKTESIEADDDAVSIVAREAAGSMRDALTLLDQIAAFSEGKLMGEEVARVLGIADRDAVHRVAGAVLGADGAEVLRSIDGLAGRGLDMLHFARQLLALFRDLVVLQVAGRDTELVAMVEEERQRAFDMGASVPLAELQRAFAAMNRAVEDTAMSGSPRIALEMGLVRLATRPPLLPLAELIARLERLEGRGGAGGASGGRPTGATGSRGGTNGGARADGARTEAHPDSPPRSEPVDAPRSDAPRSEAVDAARADVPDTDVPGVDASREAPRGEAREDTPVTARPSTSASSNVATSTPAPLDARPAPAESAVGIRAPADEVEDDAESSDPWIQIVTQLMDRKPALGAVLQHGSPAVVTAEKLVIAFPPKSFFASQAQAGAREIAVAAGRVLGGVPRVEVTFSDAAPAAGAPATLAEIERARRDARERSLRESALSHPIVRDAAMLFSIPEEALHVRVEMD